MVGWQLSKSLRTDLALDALEMGLWTRQRAGHDITGADRTTATRAFSTSPSRYTQRLAEAGAVASVGSTGDSYDNALAEAFNSLFKAELVRNKGPWKNIDDLEIAVAEYIDWFNHRRLHGEIGLIPPAEHEDTYYRHNTAATTVERVSSEPPLNPGRDTLLTSGVRRPVEPAQYTSIRYTDRLVEAGLYASIGTIADSYDNALAENVNGLYKAELVYWEGPWEGTTSSWQPWAGPTGLTTPACTPPSTTDHPPMSKPSTTVRSTPPSDRSRENPHVERQFRASTEPRGETERPRDRSTRLIRTRPS